MKPLHKIIIGIVLALGLVLVTLLFLQNYNVEVLNPKGEIAEKQRNLLIFTTLLSLVVIVPVFILTFFIAWKYRASNQDAKYTPEWDHSKKLELIWWGIPLVIITVLAVITWQTSHELDPFKPLESSKKPLTIQVVALQWKWLFIYPEENIATVNFLQVPEDTPINFQITADAPMNSFWIPQLGGQVYAMTGMTTKLHLVANETGTYTGVSANISGAGHADMKFTVKATNQADFDNWVTSTQAADNPLTLSRYKTLAEPAVAESPLTFSSREYGLYDTILMKYMAPNHSEDTMTEEGKHLMDEEEKINAH